MHDSRKSVMTRLRLFPFLATLCLLPLIGSCTSSSNEPADTEPEVRDRLTCRIKIPIEDRYRLELVVTNQTLIDTIAGQPLRDARVERKPMDYMGLGDLEIEHADGKKDSYWLFSPLGHFKKGDTYYTTDFTELRKLLRTVPRSRTWQGFVAKD
jgi:hypothetical protein